MASAVARTPVRFDRLGLSRQIDSYPYRVSLQVRYSDIDAVGHLNNAVSYGLHDVAQARFWSEQVGLRISDLRLVRARRRQMDYLRIGTWPSSLTAGVGLLELDGNVVRIASALFQNDCCINVQESLIDITPVLQPWLARIAELPRVTNSLARIDAIALDPRLLDPETYSFCSPLTPRFSDLDVHGQIGVRTVARYSEQARSNLMRHIIRQNSLPRGSLRGVVGSVKVWELSLARVRSVQLAASVRLITQRSAHFGMGIFGDGCCIAYCESVHVFVDPNDQPMKPCDAAVNAMRPWLFEPAGHEETT